MIHPTQPVPRVASFPIRSIALCVLLMLGSVHVSAQTGAIKPGEPVTLNFTGAEIEAVARTLATLSGRNVVVDPRVKGTITLVTERPVPPAAAWVPPSRLACSCTRLRAARTGRKPCRWTVAQARRC